MTCLGEEWVVILEPVNLLVVIPWRTNVQRWLYIWIHKPDNKGEDEQGC